MKRILVIGATSAIATACARQWAADGAHFFLVARSGEKLKHVASDLRVRGAIEAHTYLLDVNALDGHPAMLAACVAALGKIDIALLAHGTLPDQQACEHDPLEAVRQFTTNGTSTIALLTILGNQFCAQGGGTLAVVTSVAGDRGRPSNYLYGSAKAAVSTFCEGLRARLFRQGAHLLDIRPGFVDTPMTQELTLPKLLVAPPEAVAKRILQGVERRKDVLYAPAFWWWILLIIRAIPGAIFKRLQL